MESSYTQTPGFLIRRLHQIHTALFAEECTGVDITPAQYSILYVVGMQPGLDQASIAEAAGVDRATLASVVARLETGGFVKRTVSRLDRRQKLLSLTARGKKILTKLEAPVQRAHERTVATLTEKDRKAFITVLSALVDAGNEHGRAKLKLR